MELSETTLGGIRMWQAPSLIRLGVAHGFLGRDIDMKNPGEHLSLLLKEFPGRELKLLQQTHSTNVVAYDKNTHDNKQCADAWIFSKTKIADNKKPPLLGILTADCIPVLISSSNGEVVSAVHCGWRGSVDGILQNSFAQFERLGIKTQDLSLACGPGARGCCYEVGPEVSEQFILKEDELSIISKSSIEKRGEKLFLDLPTFLSNLAASFGVSADKIDVCQACTICEKKFFSYRREKALAGRQLSFISAKN